ncbi:hypothetical protein MPL3356_150020 [Mesorhizobium plurifarium]|uniref:Uncharacterized protein n=1 Tax=Mesorhizobium plurifarium TaxID=69974 RepID=A0A090DJN3_MESPL|nr:hypothetical protein MPL3356_150020 [Mesorhizobium plurifarium]CDX36401.1 hypothetical protein MPLDJ20_20537 [Mesorhizobium plurifarium]
MEPEVGTADSPSSGRYAATFSPRGEEVGAGAEELLSPPGRGRIAPNCPSQFGWQSG